MAHVRLTVLLASHNGAQVLPRTLEGYRQLLAPPVDWKMVIVDSGSTDSTLEVIDSFKRDLPIEAMRQPLPGKSHALNVGIEAIEADLVVLTDDDAIPAPSFLVAWAKLLDEDHGCGLFGGSIAPAFETPPPRWLRRSSHYRAMMFSERDLPEGPVAPDSIYGPNMAVAASVLKRGFRFDEIMGPDAFDPGYPMGQETEFCRRVAAAGVRCWFASEPRVHHIVRPALLTPSAWAARAYRAGRGRAYQMWKRGEIDGVPAPSLLDWIKMASPLRRHRLTSIVARHLARGFHDECARIINRGSADHRGLPPAGQGVATASCDVAHWPSRL